MTRSPENFFTGAGTGSQNTFQSSVVVCRGGIVRGDWLVWSMKSREETRAASESGVVSTGGRISMIQRSSLHAWLSMCFGRMARVALH